MILRFPETSGSMYVLTRTRRTALAGADQRLCFRRNDDTLLAQVGDRSILSVQPPVVVITTTTTDDTETTDTTDENDDSYVQPVHLTVRQKSVLLNNQSMIITPLPLLVRALFFLACALFSSFETTLPLT